MSIYDQDTAVTDVGRQPPAARAPSSDCLVLIYGDAGIPLGKHIPLSGETLSLGRAQGNDLVLRDERVSRTHARIEPRGGRMLICDAGSTNGTLVNNARLRGFVELQCGDRIAVGASIFKFLTGNDVESQLHQEIYHATITDALTGLANRRKLHDELDREFVRARRHGRALSVLMIDIDHFKDVNDHHGHVAGDAVLRATAAVVRQHTREGDIVARYGGEELAIIALEASHAEAARVAERIRDAVELNIVEHEGLSLQVTISVGCATLDELDSKAMALLERADAKLYEAKQRGRNRVGT